MRYEIKGIDSADAPDLEGWRPASLEDLYLGLTLSIGPVDQEAADLFQIVIASPQAIAGRPDRRRAKLLVVQEYDWPAIRRTLEAWVAECNADSLGRVIDRLRQKFHWEYEGMGPPA